MDSFEDFEFKPLTEGLGFHKKAPAKTAQALPPLEPKNELKSSLQSKLGSSLENIHTNSLKFETPIFESPTAQAPKASKAAATEAKVELPELFPTSNIFSTPLPRTEKDVPKKETPAAAAIPKFNPRIGRPLSNPAINDQKIQDSGILAVLEGRAPAAATTVAQETLKPNKIDTTVEVKFIETAPSALSLFLDFTVIAGLSILFMLGLVVATGLDLMPILNNAASDGGTQMGVALLIYSVSQLYLILVRSFYGQTLGEWSMDVQLGMQKEQEQVSYALKLIGRTLLLAVTGFIILPIASMIMKQDLTGRIVNLKLYRKQ